MTDKKISKLAKRIVIIEALVLAALLLFIMPLIDMLISETSKEEAFERELIINRQVIDQIDSDFVELNTVATTIAGDSNIAQLIRNLNEEHDAGKRDLLRKELELYLSNYQRVGFSYGYPIILHINNDLLYTSVGTTERELADIIHTEQYQDFMNSENKVLLLSPYEDNTEMEGVVSYAYCIKESFEIGDGCIIVAAKFNGIMNELEASLPDGNYVLLDSENRAIWPFSAKIDDEIIGALSENTNHINSKVYSQKGKNYFMTLFDTGNWKLVRILTDAELKEPYRAVQTAIYISFAVFAIVAIILIAVFISYKMKPLATLANNMKKVGQGDFDHSIAINTGDELEQLSNSFEKMRTDLKNYLEELLRQEEIQQKMNYDLLMSQIDPHFLYNAMNTVTAFANEGRTEDIVTINTALIKIMKDVLRSSLGNTIETVAHEKEVSESYIAIQKLRYRDIFELEWDIDEAVEQCMMPRNILQPLIENSIFHGILGGNKNPENIDEISGYIRVSVKEKENMLRIVVEDDGVGMSENSMAAFQTDDRHLFEKKRKYAYHADQHQESTGLSV